MSERNLEQELESVKSEVQELQQQNVQLAQALQKLSDVVKKKMPEDMFDTFVHSEIDQLTRDFENR